MIKSCVKKFKIFKLRETLFQNITYLHISDNLLTDANMISSTISRNLREWVLKRVASSCTWAEGLKG